MASVVDAAFERGREDFLEALPWQANPYAEDGPVLDAMSHAAWSMGWLRACLRLELFRAGLQSAIRTHARFVGTALPPTNGAAAQLGVLRR